MYNGHLESFYSWFSERQLYVTVPFVFSRQQRDNNARDVSFRNSLRWAIYVINSEQLIRTN